MAQLVKIRVQFSAPFFEDDIPPCLWSKTGVTSEKRLEEEEEEKAVWAEEEGGGGVEEALVPQLHLKGGGV